MKRFNSKGKACRKGFIRLVCILVMLLVVSYSVFNTFADEEGSGGGGVSVEVSDSSGDSGDGDSSDIVTDEDSNIGDSENEDSENADLDDGSIENGDSDADSGEDGSGNNSDSDNDGSVGGSTGGSSSDDVNYEENLPVYEDLTCDFYIDNILVDNEAGELSLFLQEKVSFFVSVEGANADDVFDYSLKVGSDIYKYNVPSFSYKFSESGTVKLIVEDTKALRRAEKEINVMLVKPAINITLSSDDSDLSESLGSINMSVRSIADDAKDKICYFSMNLGDSKFFNDENIKDGSIFRNQMFIEPYLPYDLEIKAFYVDGEKFDKSQGLTFTEDKSEYDIKIEIGKKDKDDKDSLPKFFYSLGVQEEGASE